MSPVVLLQMAVALTIANIVVSALSYYYTNKDVNWVVDAANVLDDEISRLRKKNRTISVKLDELVARFEEEEKKESKVSEKK